MVSFNYTMYNQPKNLLSGLSCSLGKLFYLAHVVFHHFKYVSKVVGKFYAFLVIFCLYIQKIIIFAIKISIKLRKHVKELSFMFGNVYTVY